MSSITTLIQCQETEDSYLVQFEKRGDRLLATEATEIHSEEGGGSDQTETVSVSGGISIDSSYGGCPYCGQKQFFKCFTCEKLSCYDGHSSTAYCCTCNQTIDIDGDIDEIDGQEDRSSSDDITKSDNQSSDIQKI